MSKNDETELAPTAEELRAAKELGKQIDDLAAGKPIPPALEAETRDLLVAASMIRASFVPTPLDAARADALVEQAMVRASGADSLGDGAAEPPSDLNEARRRRSGRLVPWVFAAAAAAAVLLYFLTRPPTALEEAPTVAESTDPRTLSRPADALIGQIAPDSAGDARARLDAIHADRMSGYRAVALFGKVKGNR